MDNHLRADYDAALNVLKEGIASACWRATFVSATGGALLSQEGLYPVALLFTLLLAQTIFTQLISIAVRYHRFASLRVLRTNYDKSWLRQNVQNDW